ncbi:DUF4394 domain-containing protein [Hymenobacter sp. HD11105]
MLKLSSLAKWGVAALLMTSLSSCEDLLEQYFPQPPSSPTTPPVAYTTYEFARAGNTYENGLVVFNPTTPTITRHLPITGLSAASDRILGIDLRPATGQLYALVGTNTVQTEPVQRSTITNGRLYTLNPATGAATLVAPLSFPLFGSTAFGVDFDPVVDRLRLVSDFGQNLLVNPADGTTIQYGRINPASPTTGGAAVIVGATAYDNNIAGAASTNLYVLVVNQDKLSLLTPPNTGGVVEIGSLGVDAGLASFDIGGASRKAYAVLSVATTTRFYAISLVTGAATDLGEVGLPPQSAGVRPLPTGFTLGAGL